MINSDLSFHWLIYNDSTMVKIAVFIVFVAMLIGTSKAELKEMTKLIEECKISEKVTDIDVMNMKKNVQPVTKEVKCLITCIYERLNLLKNNQLNVEGCMKLAKSLHSDEKELQSISDVIDECKSVQDVERCEFGVKAMTCLGAAADKRSMKFDLM